jgi:hypothetical protein
VAQGFLEARASLLSPYFPPTLPMYYGPPYPLRAQGGCAHPLRCARPGAGMPNLPKNWRQNRDLIGRELDLIGRERDLIGRNPKRASADGGPEVFLTGQLNFIQIYEIRAAAAVRQALALNFFACPPGPPEHPALALRRDLIEPAPAEDR